MGNELCNMEYHKILVRHDKQQFKVHAGLNDPIGQIKSKIADKKKVSVRTILLAYNGLTLDDTSTLKSIGYRIQSDHLSLSISSDESKSITVVVKNINFSQKIEIGLDKIVMDLKKKIDQKMNFPIKTQRLIFNGIVLNDNDQLGKYGLKDQSIIHLATILSGC